MKSKFSLSLLTLTSLVVSTQSAIAQTYTPSNRTPVADGTMNTQVSGNGSTFNITGGQTRGQTLFHSFTDFSVPTNGAANFINATNPRDIITRVTGNSFSDINGLVNTNGANFFLLNPNGITFGTNAQLNVGRSGLPPSHLKMVLNYKLLLVRHLHPIQPDKEMREMLISKSLVLLIFLASRMDSPVGFAVL